MRELNDIYKGSGDGVTLVYLIRSPRRLDPISFTSDAERPFLPNVRHIYEDNFQNPLSEHKATTQSAPIKKQGGWVASGGTALELGIYGSTQRLPTLGLS